MQAIILVGGFGTRLRPLTLTTPKQMLHIAGVPQLERKIAHLVSHGVTDIVLSMGYKPDAFRDAYPDNRCAGATLTYVVESEPLGTAGAIAFAARTAGVDGTFLAMNGDTLTDLDVRALLNLHESHNAEGTIALTPVDDPSRFGVVVTDATGKVSAFVEKPPKEEAPTNLINAGTYVFDTHVLARIPSGRAVSIERETFPEMAANNGLYAGNFDKYWLDIGTPEAYIQGNLDVLAQQYHGAAWCALEAEVDADAHVQHSVVEHGAKIAAHATVIDSVIGAGATIGAGAHVVHSVVGPGATVGAGAQLTQLCVLGAGVEVHEGVSLVAEKRPDPAATA